MKSNHQGLIELIREVVGRPESGAEIGVCRGDMSEQLLRAFPECDMWFVDPWRLWDEGTSYHDAHRRTGRWDQDRWDEARAEAICRIGVQDHKRGRESTVLQMTSREAASRFEESSLDFVFIDADHTYEHVKADVEMWLPKTRTLICGHDYRSVRDRRGSWGVSRAVHEIFGEEHVIEKQGRIWGVDLRRLAGHPAFQSD